MIVRDSCGKYNDLCYGIKKRVEKCKVISLDEWS
jgi:hypothetical protein